MELRNTVRSVAQFSPEMRAALHIEMLTLDPFMMRLNNIPGCQVKDLCFLMLEQASRTFMEYNNPRSKLVDCYN
jgi:hypothetical protein